jgi:2-iminobutanoate/2-iminopropanoate deaminase
MKQKFQFLTLAALSLFMFSCQQTPKETTAENKPEIVPETNEKPEYFSLRPEVEKTYGYTHAVRIGDDIKISGAVSMDDKGNLTAAGSMDQQMKNCYADLEKILKHYGCTFDDVVVENIFTTDMAGFFKVAAYRNSVYKTQFPTGTWLEVKGLALPGQLIEIDMEAHITK